MGGTSKSTTARRKIPPELFSILEKHQRIKPGNVALERDNGVMSDGSQFGATTIILLHYLALALPVLEQAYPIHVRARLGCYEARSLTPEVIVYIITLLQSRLVLP